MEFDGLFAHNVPRVVKEFRTVKNDDKSLKPELTLQILTTGDYDLPATRSGKSYTKLTIDSLIAFINH